MSQRVVKKVLSACWRSVPRSLQWRLLWFINPKFNIGVTGIILDSGHRILLLEHVYRRQFRWGLPSGWVKRGETIEAALRREVKEETGLEIEISRVFSIKSGFQLRLEFILIAKTSATELPKLGFEIISGEFFDIGSLPSGLLPDHRDILRSGAGQEHFGALDYPN